MRIGKLLGSLGPGVVSGAANDDPSCISTCAVAGAAFGYLTLWTGIVLLPLAWAVQLMSSRLGMISGRGLAGAVRVNFPTWVLLSTCGLLFAANVVNIGADLGGMAEASQMVTGIPAVYWTALWAGALVFLVFRLRYRLIERIFKWLTLVLFAYVAAAFLANADWTRVLRFSLVPGFEFSREYLAVLVGIMGAALSPYLLFWQAGLEVERELGQGKRTVREREGATSGELATSEIDVTAGAFFGRLIAYFITLTTAATLHAAGKTHIQTAREAAEALRPIAGDAAYLLFTVGLVGTGALAVPVLAASSAYALAEAAAWRASLDAPPQGARRFYAVIAISVALGVVLKLAGFSAVSLMVAAAVINGVLAPPLIVLLVLLTSSSRVMGGMENPRGLTWAGWSAAAVSAAAVVGLLISAL